MEKKLTKLVGLTRAEFDAFVKSKDITLRKAHLIPFYKIGDEIALTSVILSSLTMINEFRKMVLSDIRMPTGGELLVFTEVTFSTFPESRVDGLILNMKGGVIRDAALCEMKNGPDELYQEQIERYQALAKALSIQRIVTVSNQFVSSPTQSPLPIKPVKDVALYHFSWSYLLTLAHVLLCNNDTNIEDPDQVAIMREVVAYLEFDKSGVCGFSQMKAGWSETVNKINTGASLKCDDSDVMDTVLSWQQEESDLALMLSRNLGVLVESGVSRYRDNLKARLEGDAKALVESRQLASTLKIAGAVSDIDITALFEKRTIEMAVSLTAPSDKTAKGQLGWLRRQLEYCSQKNEDAFAKVKDQLLIEVWIKNARSSERVLLANMDSLLDVLNGKPIREFRIICLKDFGKQFASRIKFVETIERMIVDFYDGIVQYLVKWEPSAPKMSQPSANTNREQPDEEQQTEEPQAAPSNTTQPPPMETAPCPLCHGELLLKTLQVGTNICPHCRGAFQAE